MPLVRRPVVRRSLSVLTAVLLCTGTILGSACVPVKQAERAEVHSDQDGVPDYVEKELGLDPQRSDTDMDGLSDYQELTRPSSPQSARPRKDGRGAARTLGLASAALASERDTSSGVDASGTSGDQTRTPGPTGGIPGPSGPRTVTPVPFSGQHPAAVPERHKPDWNAIVARQKALLDAGIKVAANDPWRRGIAYDMTVNDVKNVHALIVGQWTWSGKDIPTVEKYVTAFKAQLANDKTTPAPCLDETRRDGGFIDADPDFGGAQLTSAAQAVKLAQMSYDNGGFGGYEYAAKIHNGLCDTDGDGIPSLFEAYGYTVDQRSGLPGGLAAWGFKVTGSATYVVSKADGSHGPFWGAWGAGGAHPTPASYYPGVVTGSGVELVPIAQRDYTDQYFKTDAGSYNTDGDADTDDAEALGDASLAADRAPWNTPAVAGSPSFRLNVQSAKVSYDAANLVFPDDPDWLDSMASVVTNAAPIVGAVLNVAAKIAPLVATEPARERMTLAAYTAAPSSEPTGTAKASAMLSDLSNGMNDVPNIVGQVKGYLRLLWPKPQQPIDWSRVTAKDPASAGTVAMTLGVVNDARVDAVDVVPGYTLMLGESVVGTYTCTSKVTLRRGGHPVAVAGPTATLSMDELKAAMTGGSFSVIPNVGDGRLHKRVGNPLQDVDLGDWDGFRSDIDRNCATVIFDAGNGYFAQYQIAATHDTTVREAFYECLRDYARDGTFLGFALTNSDPSKEARHFKIDDLRDWSVVFDSRIDPGSNKHYYWTDTASGYVNVADPALTSSLDVPLVPRSVVQFVYKDRMDTKAVFADARMSYGSLKRNTSGGLDYKSLTVTLANRSECVSAIDVYFLPDGNPASLATAQKMQTADNGVYTLELPKYQWTGSEKVVATLRGFDSTVKTDPYPVKPPRCPNVLVGYLGTARDNGADVVGYALGSADMGTGTLSWAAQGELHKGGRMSSKIPPTVAINQHGTAIALYQTDGSGGLYKVGNLKWSRDRDLKLAWTVDWGDERTYEPAVPDVAAVDINGAGVVVEVHGGNDGDPQTLYSRAGVVDTTAKSVSWGSPVKLDTGWWPDVTLAEDGRVVQMHQGLAGDSGWIWPDSHSRLYIGAGTVDRQSKTISWLPSTDTGWNGQYPTVSLNATGTVIEAHGAKDSGDKRIWYTIGQADSTGKVKWKSGGANWGQEQGLVLSPRVGLADDGSMVELHSTDNGWGGVVGHYRVGKVSTTGGYSLAMPAGDGSIDLPSSWCSSLWGGSIDIMP